jgi:hypothetical protein
MTNRKKKRRRKPSVTGGGNGTRGQARRQAAVEPAASEEADAAGKSAAKAPTEEEARPRPRGIFGTSSRMREPSPFPGFRVSVGRGLAETARSAPVLVLGFLSILVIWSAFATAGAVDLMTSKSLATAFALPPLYLLFSDGVLAFFPVVSGSAVAGLGVAIGLTIFRVLVLGAVAAMLAQRLGAPDLDRRRAFVRAIPHLVLIALAVFGVGAAIPYVAGGLLPGNFGGLLFLAGPLLGLHFLIFAPIAAVVDGASFRDAMRRSGRAARLPGGSHLALTFGYFAFALFLVSLVPGKPVDPATPSILTWAIALAATFVHLGTFAAFVYRWLAVRDLPTLDQPVRPARGASTPRRGRSRG